MVLRVLILHHFLISWVSADRDQTGNPDCPCIEWPALDQYRSGDKLIYTPAGSETSYEYPSSYGAAHCSAHDTGLEPFCQRENPPAWCGQEWCFVDKGNCAGFETFDSAYFPLANTQYSYETCGYANTFTSWYSTSTGNPLGSIIDILEGYLWGSRTLLEEEYVKIASGTGGCEYSTMCPCYECSEVEAWKTSIDLGDVGGWIKPSTSPSLEKVLSCLIRAVSQVYSKTGAKESEAGKRVGYQYFGDQLGGSTAWWPNVDWCPETYDPRLRPWYSSGSTGPKDVVIVVDVSGSMEKNKRWALAQEATTTLLDTLEWKDYATIILFNDGIAAIYSESLVSVDSCTRQKMKNWVSKQEWFAGGTNFQTALHTAFDIIKNSVAEGHTSMCQKAILFLTDGDADFSNADYESMQTKSQRYDVTFFTYALGSRADIDVCKKLACQNGGVFYPVPDGADLASIMSQYYAFFASGQEICTSSFTSYEDVVTKSILWPACLPFYDHTASNSQLLGVTCMDINLLAMPDELKEQNDGWDEFVCKMSDMTKKCQAMYLTECHKEKIRLQYNVASVCGSTSNAESDKCQCLDKSVSCEDDGDFMDEQGYFCDTWVGDDCSKAQEQWDYSFDGTAEVLQKCRRSCGLCTWSEPPCTTSASCQGHSFSAQSSKCRACVTDKVSGIDIEGNPMCCKSEAGSCPENVQGVDPECAMMSVSATSAPAIGTSVFFLSSAISALWL